MLTSLQIEESLTLELTNGILKGELKCEILDLEFAKAAVNYRIDRYSDKDYPLIINLQNVKHITKDARDYLASKDGCYKVKAGAILVDSIVTKVIANFFLQINKPLIPSRLFTNESDARVWLTGFTDV